MEEHWKRRDCALDAAIAESLLDAQAPDRGFHEVRYLGEGWDSWAYLVTSGDDRQFIFRFPKRATIVPRLEVEIRLLPELARMLPLPVPRFEVIGHPSDLYPHPFVGYELLPGTPGMDCIDEPFDAEAAGRTIGRFLAALHTFPADRALGAGLETPAGDLPLIPNQWSAEKAEHQIIEFAPGLPSSSRTRALDLLSAEIPAREAVCLAHHDFFPEHILLQDGTPSGVIDWGDIGLSDPAADFAGLFYWRGEAMLSTALNEYSRHRDVPADALNRIAQRARILAVFRAAEDLEYGAQAPRPDYYRMGHHALEQLA